MAAWFGFSDEDLKKVKTMTKNDNDQQKIKPSEPQKKATFAQTKRSQHGKPPLTATQAPVAEIDTSMKLQRSSASKTNEGPSHKIPRAKRDINHKNDVPIENDTDKPPEAVNEEVKEAESLNDKEGFDRDMMSLEKFREQQKAIEEANKQKKALLSKTITERRKKARAEAHKLEHIQRELGKLDQLLSNDVEVIRHRIEEISREYMEAEKRFQRAEAEYIAAKIDMHEKSEQKESLTEHMYTIIHQNEVRKAKKLAELMKEMEMECTEEELQLPELPPLSSFQQNIIPTSPTGLKHIVKAEDSSGTKDVHADNIKVEQESSNAKDEKLSDERASTKSEQSSQETVQNKNDESQSVQTSKPAEGDQAINLTKVKQEPVEGSDPLTQNTVHQGDSSVPNSKIVITEEVTEKSAPKIPSKWDFSGVIS